MKKLKRLRLAGFQQLSASEEAQTLGGNNSNSLAGIIVDNGDGTLIYSYDGDSSKINLNNSGGMASIGGFYGGSPGMFNAFSAGDSGVPVNTPYIGLSGYGSGTSGYPGFSGGNSGGNSSYSVTPYYGPKGYGVAGNGGSFNGYIYYGSDGVGGGVSYNGGNWGISGSGGKGYYGAGVKYSF